MGYVVLRVEKLKSRASLFRQVQHDTRERMPDNADPARTHLNMGDKAVAPVMAKYDALLPEKVRKNAVLAVQYMISLSGEAVGKLGGRKTLDYLKECRDWAIARLGGPKNVLSICLHQDEKEPHLHVTMIPLKDGKLNARAYIGGHRDVLVQMQTEIGEIGKKYGLERGRPRMETGRRHITVGRFYAIGQDAIKREIQRQKEQADADRERKKAIKEREDKDRGR